MHKTACLLSKLPPASNALGQQKKKSGTPPYLRATVLWHMVNQKNMNSQRPESEQNWNSLRESQSRVQSLECLESQVCSSPSQSATKLLMGVWIWRDAFRVKIFIFVWYRHLWKEQVVMEGRCHGRRDGRRLIHTCLVDRRDPCLAHREKTALHQQLLYYYINNKYKI